MPLASRSTNMSASTMVRFATDAVGRTKAPFISIACWMKGAFVLPTASVAKRTIVLALMFVLLLASGIYFIGGKFRSANVASADSRLRGDWQAFTPERLQAELDEGHSVFVDFTAAWCLTCK